MSGVVSATDHFTMLALGRAGFERLVKDRRTQEEVEIDDTDNPPIDTGDIGTAYAFREGQRVRADHPAVIDCPGGFRPIEPTDRLVYDYAAAEEA